MRRCIISKVCYVVLCNILTFFGKDKIKSFKLQKWVSLYGQRDYISLHETAQYADNLYQSPIKNLNYLYEQTYTEHHTIDKEGTLRQLAKEAFTAYTKQDQYKNDARSSKNVSKIAKVLHVLCHHIDNLLKLKTDPAQAKLVLTSWSWRYP